MRTNVLEVMRRWLPVMGKAAILFLLFILLPGVLQAQGILSDAQTQVQQVIKVSGYVLIVAGLFVMGKSGFKVAEGHGGWAGVGAGFILMILGYKVASSGGVASSIGLG